MTNEREQFLGLLQQHKQVAKPEEPEAVKNKVAIDLTFLPYQWHDNKNLENRYEPMTATEYHDRYMKDYYLKFTN